jgi:hypothetical protein
MNMSDQKHVNNIIIRLLELSWDIEIDVTVMQHFKMSSIDMRISIHCQIKWKYLIGLDLFISVNIAWIDRNIFLLWSLTRLRNNFNN